MSLQHHTLKAFQTHTGHTQDLEITYQLFGLKLGTAAVVLVNHALTGNSSVTGERGWWSDLIGPQKAINTEQCTVLAIDIPGNGASGREAQLITNYKAFNNGDIARVQIAILEHLQIENLFAVIGGSLGGQIAWELAIKWPNKIEHLIAVATDWKATDWVIAQCHIQDGILNNSLAPIEDARKHAMTFYRTPASFKEKFGRTKRDKTLYNIQSWLNHHGKRLSDRFTLASYKLMNHLLLSADITAGVTSFEDVIKNVEAQIHLIAINTDGLFLADEMYGTHLALQALKKNSSYQEITSIHGHDAFLIEYEQLEAIVKPIFQNQLCHK